MGVTYATPIYHLSKSFCHTQERRQWIPLCYPNYKESAPLIPPHPSNLAVDSTPAHPNRHSPYPQTLYRNSYVRAIPCIPQHPNSKNPSWSLVLSCRESKTKVATASQKSPCLKQPHNTTFSSCKSHQNFRALSSRTAEDSSRSYWENHCCTVVFDTTI